MLIACCPGGSSSNIFSKLAKGDVALPVSLTALSSIITLFTLPLIMQNAAQAIAVATSPFVFANAVIATPAIIYALLMNVVLLTYVAFFRVAKK